MVERSLETAKKKGQLNIKRDLTLKVVAKYYYYIGQQKLTGTLSQLPTQANTTDLTSTTIGAACCEFRTHDQRVQSPTQLVLVATSRKGSH